MPSAGLSEAASALTQSSEIHGARQLHAFASVVEAADEMAARRLRSTSSGSGSSPCVEPGVVVSLATWRGGAPIGKGEGC